VIGYSSTSRTLSLAWLRDSSCQAGSVAPSGLYAQQRAVVASGLDAHSMEASLVEPLKSVKHNFRTNRLSFANPFAHFAA